MMKVLLSINQQGSPSDIACVVVGGIAVLIILIGDAIIIVNRKWTPFVVKQVNVTLSSSISGCIWIIAAMVSLNLFARPADGLFGAPLCILWACMFSLSY